MKLLTHVFYVNKDIYHLKIKICHFFCCFVTLVFKWKSNISDPAEITKKFQLHFWIFFFFGSTF